MSIFDKANRKPGRQGVCPECGKPTEVSLVVSLREGVTGTNGRSISRSTNYCEHCASQKFVEMAGVIGKAP